MRRSAFRPLAWRHCRSGLGVVALWLLSVSPLALANSLPEPHKVIYGKVIHAGAGAAYQLYAGQLSLVIVDTASPSRVLTLNTPLYPVADGEFSYRLEIDQESAPFDDRQTTTLVAAPGKSFAIQSATVDGRPALPFDARQLPVLSTSGNDRRKEFRFDFITNVPQTDSDGDSMPDSWESLYGLDALSGSDAGGDPDGDGWSNAEEFRRGTDPNGDNRVPLLQNATLLVTAGGNAGVYFSVVDTDTSASLLQLTLLEDAAGLTWRNGEDVLGAGDAFSYADVLAGRVSVDVALDYTQRAVRFLLEDLGSDAVVPAETAVRVEVFSPGSGLQERPAVWLDAERVAAAERLAEWPDLSGSERDGYQPELAFQPSADGAGRVEFSGAEFLYLDDRDLSLADEFTAFAVFGAGEETASPQTLFSSSDVALELTIEEAGAGLRVVQNGSSITGPAGEALAFGRTPGVTLMQSAGVSTIDFRLGGGTARFTAVAGDESLLSSYATLGGARALSSTVAERLFTGDLSEVLVYDGALGVFGRRLVQDYQASRWDGVRVWNYRLSTVPLVMHGDDTVSNVMNGGESADELTGGSQSDTLRGGPGANTLTGGRSGDRFSFEAQQTADVVTDFSEWENDVIDLVEVLAGKSGPLANYLSIKSVVTRDESNAPRVDSILQLNHAGLGTASGVDQTITLEGVAVGNSDLPRLLAQGSIVTGRAEERAVSVDPLVVDSDGDGVLDAEDALPYDATETVDTDGDRIGNNADLDDDGDGFADELDRFPLDASEWFDTDNDGIGNNADLDDDNDGWSDTREIAAGTNPLDRDSYPVLPERRGLPAGVLELLLGD